MTQFDKDIQGEYAEIFLKLREILLSFPEIKEIKNAKQTSYRDSYGVIAMLRDRGDRFVVSLGRGATLLDKYPFLEGSGKIVRHLYFVEESQIDEALLKEIIQESLVLNIEKHELQVLKKYL